MRNKNIIFTFYLLVIILTILLSLIFIPKQYDVEPQKPRAGAETWEMSDGSKISFVLIRAKGKEKPNPVIFLQGGPGAPIYDRNIELYSTLADSGYNVYLYDQIGCGFSDRLEQIEEYTVKRHKRDLEEIVQKIGAEKVILIGQSWGAMLATVYAADNQYKLEKMVLSGPGPILPINTALENINAPDSLQLRSPQNTNKQGMEKVYNLRARITELFAKKFDWKLASDSEMDDFANVLNYEMAKSTLCNPSVNRKLESGSGYYSMVKTTQSLKYVHHVRVKLSNSSIPVLIMRGQCDGIPWGFTAEYLQLFPNHQLKIIPGAGHSIGYEQPELYSKTILDFLNQ